MYMYIYSWLPGPSPMLASPRITLRLRPVFFLFRCGQQATLPVGSSETSFSCSATVALFEAAHPHHTNWMRLFGRLVWKLVVATQLRIKPTQKRMQDKLSATFQIKDPSLQCAVLYGDSWKPNTLPHTHPNTTHCQNCISILPTARFAKNVFC